jgi:hypothetical protein
MQLQLVVAVLVRLTMFRLVMVLIHQLLLEQFQSLELGAVHLVGLILVHKLVLTEIMVDRAAVVQGTADLPQLGEREMLALIFPLKDLMAAATLDL